MTIIILPKTVCLGNCIYLELVFPACILFHIQLWNIPLIYHILAVQQKRTKNVEACERSIHGSTGTHSSRTCKTALYVRRLPSNAIEILGSKEIFQAEVSVICPELGNLYYIFVQANGVHLYSTNIEAFLERSAAVRSVIYYKKGMILYHKLKLHIDCDFI
jgi:hypothetical protein